MATNLAPNRVSPISKSETKRSLDIFRLWLSIKKDWKTVVLVISATLLNFYISEQLYSTLYWVSMASITAALWLRSITPLIGEQRGLFAVIQGIIYAMVASPVIAQATGGTGGTGGTGSVTNNAAACTTSGLFSALTNFVSTLFNTVTFGGIGGGQLSNLICQVIGLVTVALILGFIGVISQSAYQIGFNQQPPSAVVNPVFGFLVFAGGSSVVISVLL